MRMRLVVAVLAVVACGGAVLASSPHYVNGTQGLNVASLPLPGKYYAQSNYFYHAGQVRGPHGNKLDAGFNFDIYMNTHAFMWGTEKKIFGANYSIGVAVPIVYIATGLDKDIQLPDFMGFRNVNLAMADHSTGLSDIAISPLLLNWRSQWIDVRWDTSFFLPSGRYDQNDPTSVGRGFWTYAQGLGVTVYFDKEKTWNASIMGYYEFHTKQRQTGITPGNHYHFDYGIGKRFAKHWQAGIAGYASWQITEDRGYGASSAKTRAFAVGPEINVVIPKLKNTELILRSVWEFGNRSNTQGNATNLSFYFSF